jgi:hypothetical protein
MKILIILSLLSIPFVLFGEQCINLKLNGGFEKGYKDTVNADGRIVRSIPNWAMHDIQQDIPVTDNDKTHRFHGIIELDSIDTRVPSSKYSVKLTMLRGQGSDDGCGQFLPDGKPYYHGCHRVELVSFNNQPTRFCDNFYKEGNTIWLAWSFKFNRVPPTADNKGFAIQALFAQKPDGCDDWVTINKFVINKTSDKDENDLPIDSTVLHSYTGICGSVGNSIQLGNSHFGYLKPEVWYDVLSEIHFSRDPKKGYVINKIREVGIGTIPGPWHEWVKDSTSKIYRQTILDPDTAKKVDLKLSIYGNSDLERTPFIDENGYLIINKEGAFSINFDEIELVYDPKYLSL